MPPYDERLFLPPAPVLSARVRNPQSGTIVPDVRLLIDTGADVTLLPLSTVNAAGIEQTGASYELLAFDGRPKSAGVVHAELLMLGRTFRGQFLVIDQEVGIIGRTFRGQFLVIDQEVGIIGRTILNALALLLDGPQQTWSEHRGDRITSR